MNISDLSYSLCCENMNARTAYETTLWFTLYSRHSGSECFWIWDSLSMSQVSNPLSFCSAITSALILTCHLIGKYMYRFLKSHIHQWKRRIKKMLLRDSSSSALFFLASTKGFPRNPAANLTMIHWRKPSVGNQANKRPSTRERHWNSDSMASSPTSLCFL